MCSPYCLEFCKEYLKEEEVKGKQVLEVGSLDVNGTFRHMAEAFHPARYVGVDLKEGAGVDLVLDAENLLEEFKPRSFDVLLSTEMLEHARDWRKIIHNFKTVLKSGGVILITTRSEGFPFHEYPRDYWRFSVDDMRQIFSDFEDVTVLPDPYEPGVFVKAKKPAGKAFTENNLEDFELYSTPILARTKEIPG